MNKTMLRKYAKLIVKMGVNIKKGQGAVLMADTAQADFALMVADEAYKAGAKWVDIRWTNQEYDRLRYRKESLKTLSVTHEWEKARMQQQVEELPVRIWIDSDDPDGLKGVNVEKMQKANLARMKVRKPYRDAMESKHQWTIVAVPSEKWAKKVFPGLPRGKAMEKLWEAILFTSRVDSDPIAAWQAHNAELKQRCNYLNGLNIRSLHYTAANGTDLTVGMIPEAQFCGGEEISLQGISFNPNIPSEECFISPKRGEAEGIVYSTKPLSYEGQLIENFWIRFEGGKAVESGAEKGAELLNTMLHMDEGAAYLGECALVPQHSPIAESGILFYNTLFDENASCHLAMGMGFPDTIRDYHSKTLEECRALGVNDSMIHEDFMIGCDTMNIDAVCADGKVVPVFRNGNWAF